MIFASIVGLLRTIVFIVGFLLIMRFLVRYILPWVAKFFIGRTLRKMQNAQGKPHNAYQDPNEVEKKVGNVTVRFNPNKKKNTTKNNKDDDYADFEVIE